jgi:hypothetical protein
MTKSGHDQEKKTGDEPVVFLFFSLFFSFFFIQITTVPQDGPHKRRPEKLQRGDGSSIGNNHNNHNPHSSKHKNTIKETPKETPAQ